MNNSLEKLTPDERQLYNSLHLRRDTLTDAEYAEYINLLDKMQVNRGGRHRSKQSKKRTTTRRRRSSKNKSRKMNKRRR